MNLYSWYCINNTPSALQISFSLWMSQCEDLGSSDGLLNSLSFFSREVKSLISSLHSFNIQMSFGRPGLRAGGWNNFSINFIPADCRETQIARLHCTVTSPQHVVLFPVLLLSCFSTQLLHALRFSLLDKLFCWRKKNLLLENSEVICQMWRWRANVIAIWKIKLMNLFSFSSLLPWWSMRAIGPQMSGPFEQARAFWRQLRALELNKLAPNDCDNP